MSSFNSCEIGIPEMKFSFKLPEKILNVFKKKKKEV